MDKRYIVAGAVGLGVVVLVATAAALTSVPQAHTGSWKPVPIDANTEGFALQTGQVYGISDFTRGQQIAYDPLKQDFAQHGLKVLDITTTMPQDWPVDDQQAGKAYVILTPEKDVVLPLKALSSPSARIFVLA